MRQGDLFWKLDDLSDGAVLGAVSELVGSSRRLLAALLAHLGEVEERRLHLAAGYSSMFAYCVARLALSEDEAYRRVEVARLARRFPALFPLLAEGRVSLSVAALLKTHIETDNVAELLHLVSGVSVQRARELLAARFPRPDVPATIRTLPAQRKPKRPDCLPGLLSPPSRPPQTADAASSTPSSEGEAPVAPTVGSPSRVRPRVEPLAEARYKIQFTADAALKKQLELAQDLLRHTLPSGDLPTIVARALDLLVEQLMKRRFGARTKRAAHRSQHAMAAATAASADDAPRSESMRRPTRAPSNVSRATRREVLERDGLRCSFRSDDGVQCDARAWLEDDHIHPRARGGSSGAANVRFLCKAHNLWEAERAYGRAHVEDAIRRRRAERGPTANA